MHLGKREDKVTDKGEQRLLTGIIYLIVVIFVAGCQAIQTTPTITDTSPTTITSTNLPPTSEPTPVSIPTPAVQNRPLLMAHYMPWYQAPSVSGYWGWHWTMDHFKPAQKDENGRQDIASHYTPLTGAYDSSDEALLEYQVLLMKLSGIDGVIVDWYGTEDFWDYAVLNESTHKLFHFIKKAGLLFAICYEDQTVKHLVDNKRLEVEDVYVHGQEVMRYLQDTWFGEEAYLKAFDRPVLFIFGPQYFKKASDWEMLFSGLDPLPVFITLDKHTEPAATSSFPWPPMWAAQNGILTQEALENYLAEFYKKAEHRDYVVAGAFPAFHDIYQEAGVGSGYGYLDAQQGETFRFTLQTALSHNPDVVQLITWNDYGEGTIIEPTTEFGYQYLEMVQDTRRLIKGSDFPFEAEDLRLPLQLFRLRKKYAHDAEINARLDEAFDAIISGELNVAADIIASYP